MNRPTLQCLIELQEIDSKIYILETEKQTKPTSIKEHQDAIIQQKQVIEDAKNEVKKTKIAIDKKDLSLKEKEEKINHFNVQLNTARTNREYSALLKEINGFKADVAVLEDEILELFSKNEEFQKNINSALEDVTRAETKLNQLKQEVERDLQAINKELTTCYETRNKFIEKIPSEFLFTYERLITHKSDKIALAAVNVDEEVCQGCFMNLTPQEINRLFKAKELVCCRTCSRILYLKPTK